MPHFTYKAKSLTGQPKDGVIEAENEKKVAELLRAEGYILIAVREEKENVKKKMDLSFIPIFGKVSLTEKLMFTRNMGIMVKSGISLPKALKILAMQGKSPKFKRILIEISDEVMKGRNFSECLEKYPDVFSELFCSMVKVGEESGTLEEVLKFLTSQMEKDYELKSKIKGAMMYPAVILVAMLCIGVLMLVMVVPKLAATFKDLNIELPFTTKIVIGFGNLTAQFWYLIPFILLAFYVIFKLLARTKGGKKLIDTISLRIPFIGPIVKKTNTAYTVRTLSSLLSAGVPIVHSLELVANSLKNSFYKNAIVKSAEEVRKGAKLGEVLGKYDKIYPPLVSQMIEIGEETGETSDILQKLAVFYEDEVSNATKNLSTIIEPALMIVIGIVVGFFVVSMIQPMYGMIQGM